MKTTDGDRAAKIASVAIAICNLFVGGIEGTERSESKGEPCPSVSILILQVSPRLSADKQEVPGEKVVAESATKATAMLKKGKVLSEKILVWTTEIDALAETPLLRSLSLGPQVAG